MRLKIRHATQYRFDGPVSYGLQQLRMTPKTTSQQRILDWSIAIDHGRKELAFDDHHNNHVALISFDRGTTALSVTCAGEVEIADTSGIVGAHRGPAPLWLYRRATDQTRATGRVKTFLRSAGADPSLDGLHQLATAVGKAVRYQIGASRPDWSAEDALEAGSGVCQDHAHVFLACARALGVPARYVSGYLMLNDTTAQDAMHAWAEAHVDGLGWVGFDISNGIAPDTRYVRVATGLDYADASPVSGLKIGGPGEALAVTIDVAQQ